MLDSTTTWGPSFNLKCPLSPYLETLRVRSDQPAYGHMGESLEGLPPVIGMHSDVREDKVVQILRQSTLLRIKPYDFAWEDEVRKDETLHRDSKHFTSFLVSFEPYRFEQSDEEYHYGGYFVPPFGCGYEQVLWVSEYSAKAAGDNLYHLLDLFLRDHWSKKIDRFWSGVEKGELDVAQAHKIYDFLNTLHPTSFPKRVEVMDRFKALNLQEA